jgi:hypothetical protein
MNLARKENFPTDAVSGFLQEIESDLKHHNTMLFRCHNKREPYQYMHIDRLKTVFLHSSNPTKNADSFLSYMKDQFSPSISENINSITLNQSNSQKWFQYRAYRITASKIYEAAHCKIDDGSLVERMTNGKVFNATEERINTRKIHYISASITLQT